MKNLLFTSLFALTAFGVISCSSKDEQFEGAKALMIEQIETLDSIETIEQLMAVQVEHGDTIVELMTVIEPQLSEQQMVELRNLNMNYNQKLRKIIDSLVQFQVVDSVVLTQTK